ncbi:hypothetical protein Sjap_001241 [Stephania japonica]|uniref:tRNA dimethylallyltransferase 2 n=1 Tax=Stephania japonica TaxID=461633 RepID=A0AAP0PUU9_9MAGN
METDHSENPNDMAKKTKKKPKLVVIMGATGAGKSRLAVDLGSHFPIEIINADSMQVYKGLDVLTNKLPLHDQKGLPHHLLGTLNPNLEFTSKHFRDSAIQIIEGIVSRNRLPVVVGGTNYYIQALVSRFLLDDFVEDMDVGDANGSLGDEQLDYDFECETNEANHSYDRLKEIDPDAANRIHPNDYRRANLYLRLYARSGIVPSKLLQGKAAEKWGRTDDFRYDCCFICVDASLPVLDQFVEDRVDCMINAGLLYEVSDVYCQNADYTRGLRQAIGVREFEDFLRFSSNPTASSYPFSDNACKSDACFRMPESTQSLSKENLKVILDHSDDQCKILLNDAIEKLKINTKRLVRRQRRRFNRLRSLFGWNLHYVDATESLSALAAGSFDETWSRQVVEPSVNIMRSFLNEDVTPDLNPETHARMDVQRIDSRDLWRQHVCEACGNRVLRGAHEWEQHKQGRGHRKRVLSLKKSKQYLIDRESLAPSVSG